MKTASWFTHGGAPGRIGISLGTPRNQPAGFRLFRQLAPRREMLDWPRQRYEREFFAMLGQMDPQKVFDQLHQMTPGGAEPVLLCYEKPPFTEANWCHRRMVAQWFEATLGVEAPELNWEGADLPLTTSPNVRRA